jgi:hypothetical protein
VGVYRITATTTTNDNDNNNKLVFFFGFCAAALNQEFKLGCWPFVFQRPKKVQLRLKLRQC